MKFGVREITDVVFKAKSTQKIGDETFQPGEPVIYFDSAKTSTMESASTTVYAQGGRGNPRLLAWEGDKTATFTFEEALLSPLGFSILSGANLIENKRIPFRHTVRLEASAQEVGIDGATGTVPVLDLTGKIPNGAQVLGAADANLQSNGVYSYPMANIYVMELEDGEVVKRVQVDQTGGGSNEAHALLLESAQDLGGNINVTNKFVIAAGHKVEDAVETIEGGLEYGKTYLVDFYALQEGTEMTVSAGKFAGYYYIEADTLFRRASDGKDVPAQFVIPRGKIQSNFTFTMAGSGDPSTFTFVVDAFPDYTMFDQSCKVLFALQVADEAVDGDDC